MGSVLLNCSDELKNIFLEYYLYLSESDFESDKSFEYIFIILNCLEINTTYLKIISFSNCVKSQGIYLPEEKKIIINPNTIKACNDLGYISRQEMVLSYFNVLIHEIIHVKQKIYKDNYNDDLSEILSVSENLKFLSNNDRDLHSLFPDETNANINSSVFLYNLRNTNEFFENYRYLEKLVIYYTTLGIIHNGKLINSQIKYLYNILLNKDFDENFESLTETDHLYLGLTKSDIIFKGLLNSYQTQTLCFDINEKGGFEYEQRNKQKKLCRLYE